MGDQNVSLLVDMKNGKECRLEAIAAIEALQQQVAELECAVRLAVSDLTIDKSFAEQLIHEAREKCNG